MTRNPPSGRSPEEVSVATAIRLMAHRLAFGRGSRCLSHSFYILERPHREVLRGGPRRGTPAATADRSTLLERSRALYGRIDDSLKAQSK
jgi:hypothetical protein